MILSELILFACGLQIASAANGDKLLLIMIDGFRWDYFDLDLDLPGFDSFIKNGVKAEYMVPVYPSLTFPNMYSIVTGLYPEKHGMVGNYMFDKDRNKTFQMGKGPTDYESFWWNDGEPLWVTAEKQNLRTSWYFWYGTEATIRNTNPYKMKPYSGLPPSMDDLEWAIRSGINDFVNESVSVVGIYAELLDTAGHLSKPDSAVFSQTLKSIDSKLQILKEELRVKNLIDDVNVMIMSDHGMTAVSFDKLINITKAVEKSDLLLNLDMGACTSLWPAENKEEKVYNALKDFHPHLHVYLKEDIPERFHLKNHSRVPPIYLMADLPWSIVTFDYTPGMADALKGLHGFDNEEKDMRGIFLAQGPDFQRGRIIKPFIAVELYGLMCRMLNITSAENDGRIANIESMFIDKETSASSKIFQAENLLLFLVMAICSWLVTKH